MIRIHTVLESLLLEPEELRGHDTIGFCFLSQKGKIQYISEEQYQRETCPQLGVGEPRRKWTSDDVFRGIHWCIALTLKNGERYLIDAGSNIFVAGEVGKQLISRIVDSIVSRETLTVIDVCRLRDACEAPNDGAPVRLISGKEAEELLACRSGRQAKSLRTKDWQISIDPFDSEISKTVAFFILSDHCHETGAISKEAFKIHEDAQIFPRYLPEEEYEKGSYPINTITEYYVRIRTHGETYLLLAGYQEESVAHWLRRIGDWMAGDEPLLDLTDEEYANGGVPQLISRGETQKIMPYLHEFGISPSLP